MAPTVSVIVPAFDAERFLGEALDGVLAQDYPADRVEVIVVDDGSTDATPQIAARYAAADDRIRVVHRPNGGQVAATNTALEHATGELIALLDADDVWVRDKLRHSVAVLEARPEVGLVYGDMTVIDAERKVLQESWLANDVTPEGRHCAGALIVGNNVTCSSVVLRGLGPAGCDADPRGDAVVGLVDRGPRGPGRRARLSRRAAHPLPLPRREHVRSARRVRPAAPNSSRRRASSAMSCARWRPVTPPRGNCSPDGRRSTATSARPGSSVRAWCST